MTAALQIKTFPQLRFPEFSKAWETVTIKQIGTVITGSTPPTSDVANYGVDYDFVGPGDMNSGRFVANSKSKLSQKGFDTSREIEASSTLVVCIGSTIGKIAQNKKVVATNQQINSVVAHTNFNKDFVYLTLLRISKRISLLAGQQAIPLLSKSEFSKISIAVTDLDEQIKISNFLNAVDDKISILTQEVALFKKYKKGAMQALFTQNIRFKDSSGKLYPNWQNKELREVAEVNPKSNNLPSEFIYIDLESVSSGRLLREKRIQKVFAPSRAQRLLQVNDILFQTVRPYQRNNLFFNRKGDYVASTGYAQIRATQKPKFIYQLLHTDIFVNSVLGHCIGTSYPAINSNDLAKISISIPSSAEEQQKIASFLTDLDDKINLIENKLEQAKNFKMALLQQMFV